MAEKIEILRGDFIPVVSGQAALTAYQSFTVNTAVRNVTTNNAAAAWSWVFSNGVGYYKFSPRDNIRILSFWLVLPYHFVLANEGAGIAPLGGGATLAWTRYGSVSGSAMIPEFGGVNSGIYAPEANTETALDVYVPWPGAAADAWTALRMSQTFQQVISMIGTPAALNGLVFYPTPFCKVLHTIDLLP